ncbi:tRNA (adenosine(37)-N6)-dimethylallyltransferase MiaA [Pedobacter sp.]|jgi:tRNA dimethylallyltransferase|uniref:tRNA (adenosine(37)-N6)-dimethylallyltransferase MiaA n=1 Tax=Pedobacter sp. TaxID=1411316 RepID=UPI002C0436C0|nr:tRNA (adenosine(37)-N6)-dimethylallyltransferase MiaA [Pedobacter sp.]HWW39610.1 tRNA (adenosine(37)-N6)-dimethylallyltransferase MiaA [Pedobacter sp.]
MQGYPLLIVLGPTASGKTRLAVSLADALNGEIISADSRQVFRGMDIGTGKDLGEYVVEGRPVPYHLIDHKQAGERYQVDAFKEDFYRVFEFLTSSKKLPVLCGGTGMYIHSILQQHEYTSIPVQQEFRERIQHFDIEKLRKILATYPIAYMKHADQSTVKRLIRAIEIAEYLNIHPVAVKTRPEFNPLVIGLTADVEVRRARIWNRLESRLEGGMIEEAEALLKAGISKDMLIFYGLEYKFMVAYLSGELNFQELKERLFTAICQYAKRQMTFFRKMEKDGVKIHWMDTEQSDAIEAKVIELYKEHYSVQY